MVDNCNYDNTKWYEQGKVFATFAALLLSLGSVVFAAGYLNSNVTHNDAAIKQMQSRVNQVEEKQQSNRDILVEIRTRWASVDQRLERIEVLLDNAATE